jgi:hypothetical protein
MAIDPVSGSSQTAPGGALAVLSWQALTSLSYYAIFQAILQYCLTLLWFDEFVNNFLRCIESRAKSLGRLLFCINSRRWSKLTVTISFKTFRLINELEASGTDNVVNLS